MTKVSLAKVNQVHNMLRNKAKFIHVYGGMMHNGEIEHNFDYLFKGFARKQEQEMNDILLNALNRSNRHWSISIITIFDSGTYHAQPGMLTCTLGNMDASAEELCNVQFDKFMSEYTDTLDELGLSDHPKPISYAWICSPHASYEFNDNREVSLNKLRHLNYFDVEKCNLIKEKLDLIKEGGDYV